MHVNASIEETSTSVKPSARKSKLRYMKKFIVWTDADRLKSMLTNYGVIAALLASIAFASLVSTTPEDYDALRRRGSPADRQQRLYATHSDEGFSYF